MPAAPGEGNGAAKLPQPAFLGFLSHWPASQGHSGRDTAALGSAQLVGQGAEREVWALGHTRG